MAASILVATYLGLNPPGFAAETVALAFGIAAASIFPVLMMGIFSKRVNNRGAVAGMLTGLGFTLIYVFMHKGWLFIPDTNQFPDTVEGSLFGLKSTAIGAVGAILNFAVAIIVSRQTEDTPQEIKDLVDSVRSPRGAADAVAHH
jgi:cation/acetate symporter